MGVLLLWSASAFWSLGSGLTPGECSECLAVFREWAFLGFSCIQRIRLGLRGRCLFGCDIRFLCVLCISLAPLLIRRFGSGL